MGEAEGRLKYQPRGGDSTHPGRGDDDGLVLAVPVGGVVQALGGGPDVVVPQRVTHHL